MSDLDDTITEHSGDHACMIRNHGAPQMVWYVEPHRGGWCQVRQLAVRARDAEQKVDAVAGLAWWAERTNPNGLLAPVTVGDLRAALGGDHDQPATP